MTSAAEVSILSNTQLMYVIGSLIALLLAIIGFYTVRYFNSQDDKNAIFYSKIEELTLAISNLTILLQQNSKDHSSIEDRVASLEKDNKNINIDIALLKSKK